MLLDHRRALALGRPRAPPRRHRETRLARMQAHVRPRGERRFNVSETGEVEARVLVVGCDGLLPAGRVAKKPKWASPELYGGVLSIGAYLISNTIETLAVTLCSPAAVGVGGGAAASLAAKYTGRGVSIAPSCSERIGPSVTPAALA